MPRAGHRDRSTASIDHRHRKIPPAFASNHLRSIRHNESERRRIGEFLEASSWHNGYHSYRLTISCRSNDILTKRAVSPLLVITVTTSHKRSLGLTIPPGPF